MSGGQVYLRPQRLIYVRAVGAYETAVPEAWEQLLGWVDKNGFSSLVESWYGLARDPAGAECRYDACVPVDPMFEDRALRELGMTSLPNGAYVRQKFRGKYADLVGTFSGFYSSFPASGDATLDVRRPMVSIYFKDPRTAGDGDLRAEICVPVSAERAGGKDKAAA